MRNVPRWLRFGWVVLALVLLIGSFGDGNLQAQQRGADLQTQLQQMRTELEQLKQRLPTAPAPAQKLYRPTVVDEKTLDPAVTLEMRSSTKWVLLMTVALAFLYAGMARQKNCNSLLWHHGAVALEVLLLFWLIGYTLAFTPGIPVIGSLERIALKGMVFLTGGQVSVSHLAPMVPESDWFFYQMAFAIITPLLMAGAWAERMKAQAVLLFSGLWIVIVYSPIAHWVWGGAGALLVGPDPAKPWVLDGGGALVIHLAAGASALIVALMLGRRRGYDKNDLPVPHNFSYVYLGMAILQVGWVSFNAGAAGMAAGTGVLTTYLAGAAGAMVWVVWDKARSRKFSLLCVMSGNLGGLVAITGSALFVSPLSAVIIGIVGGAVCYGAENYLKTWGKNGLYDDPLGAVAFHGFGGAWSALAVGIFADPAVGGFSANFLAQLLGVIVVGSFAMLFSLGILATIKYTIGLRVSPEEEEAGLDIAELGEPALYAGVAPASAIASETTVAAAAPVTLLAVTKSVPEEEAVPEPIASQLLAGMRGIQEQLHTLIDRIGSKTGRSEEQIQSDSQHRD